MTGTRLSKLYISGPLLSSSFLFTHLHFCQLLSMMVITDCCQLTEVKLLVHIGIGGISERSGASVTS